MPPGFSFLHVLRPHDPYHGGLIVFFKKMFKARKIEVPVFQTFEAIIVEFFFERRKVFVFGIYRPGSKLVTSLFFGELTSVLEHLFALGDGLIVAGDFNIHIERPGDTHSINLLEIFDSFQLTNVVNEPTHNLGGTLNLVASTPDIPLSNCRVDPSGGKHLDYRESFTSALPKVYQSKIGPHLKCGPTKNGSLKSGPFTIWPPQKFGLTEIWSS
ncbi:hypothetical protein HELRODRAFT_172376 [Helobdella robusta]|uniref:Endonuclease/exonuclease/phosphatase domain-containing protein n=1 Tax=Helobdella robusta TaxID=6412 RepID=T1F586_HELRO|nr:hypothetical protein HELRODRAFT_172376 [Helobdella robusta]ESO04703.1 hypothetical protein HELRODRAFT_172376 [Helobdella robusta]